MTELLIESDPLTKKEPMTFQEKFLELDLDFPPPGSII